MRAWKKLRIPLGLMAIAALVAAALWPSPVTVDVMEVRSGRMTVTIDEEGESRVRDRFVISAPVAGRLQRIELEPGDRVAAGVVARLWPADPPLLDQRALAELQAAAAAAEQVVGEAEAQRTRAIAAHERAAASAQRLANLVEIGGVSREDFDTAQTNARTAAAAVTAAEFALQRAQHELHLARARLLRPDSRSRVIEVRSPADGVVLKRFRESESIVAAGEPLLEIGDPARLEFVVDLLSTDAVRVSAGDRVSIERWGGAEALGARVRRIEPSGFLKVSALGVEEQRVNVIVDFDDPACAAEKIGDGYRAEARIVVWEADDAVMAPLGSLFRHGDAWAVFVVEGDRAHRRDVVLGERNTDVAHIVAGLSAGERVILFPSDTLVDGARIRVRER